MSSNIPTSAPTQPSNIWTRPKWVPPPLYGLTVNEKGEVVFKDPLMNEMFEKGQVFYLTDTSLTTAVVEDGKSGSKSTNKANSKP
jgi:hypothetical protein